MQERTPQDTYTHGHHESVLRSHTWRTADNSAGYLLPHLQPGHALLDVGCGPGTITLDLARRVAPGRVVGVDIAQAVVDIAAENLGAKPTENVDFVVDDVYGLDAPDNSFDVVHAHQVLQHLSDPVRALREMRRVRKPGGIVAVRDADYGGMFWAGADERLDRWLELYRAVARGNDAEPDAARHLVRWAAEAGFEDVTASAETWIFSTPAEREWWGGLWADRTVSSAFGTQAVESGLSTKIELQDLADAWRAWIAHPHGWFAVVNGQLICRS